MNIDVIKPLDRLHIKSGSKVSAVCFHDSKLFVGFNNGGLQIYSSNTLKHETTAPAVANSSLSNYRSFKEFQSLFSDNERKQRLKLDVSANKITKNETSIVKIRILPISNDINRTILAIGTPDFVSVYESYGSHISLLETFEDSRSYSDYKYAGTKDKKYLIISVKKRLVIYQIENKTRNIFSFVQVKDLTLKERIRTMESLSSGEKNWLLVALVNELVLVDFNDDFSVNPCPPNESVLQNFNYGTSFGYFGLSYSGPSTWILHLTQNKLMIIKDTQSLILNSIDEQPTLSPSTVKLSVVPLFVTFISPSYLFLIYQKRVEIIDYESGDLIQKFDHHINSSHISVTHKNDILLIGSGNDIFEFDVLDVQTQLDQYLMISGKDYESKGIKAPTTDPKIISLNRAISLISNLDERDEFFEFDNVSKKKQKQLVLRELFRSKALLLFEHHNKYHESLVELGSEWLLSYKDFITLFPDFLNGELAIRKDSEDKSSIQSNSKSVVKRVSLEDIEEHFTFKSNNLTTVDSGTDNHSNDTHLLKSKSSFATFKPDNNDPPISKSQNIRKFTKAVNNFIIYLTDQRRIHASFSNDASHSISWKGVSFSVLDIYPFIDKGDIQNGLLQILSIIDTTLFLCYFHTRPMLLGPLLRLPNNRCDSGVVNECLLSRLHIHSQNTNHIKDLLDFYYGRSLHEEALEMLYKLSHENITDHENEFDDYLKRSELTIQYLTKLSNQFLDLILKFARWVLTEDPKYSLRNSELLFMNETYECEGYDSSQIITFLLSELKKDELGIRYLEWLLFESDTSETRNQSKSGQKLHTRLCLLYLKKLKELNPKDDIISSKYYPKLFRFLQDTNNYEPWTVLKNIPTTDDRFLVFTVFVYRRLGEHEKAIDVLFNQLDDLEAAMEYCSDIYQTQHQRDVGTRLFHKLLDDLLVHADENIARIGQLLKTNGSKMSVLNILASLPNSYPLQHLTDFLEDTLQTSRERLLNSRLANSLYKVGTVKLQDKLVTARNVSYTVESGRQKCSYCKQNLGYSIFTCDSKNQIIHYGCSQKN